VKGYLLGLGAGPAQAEASAVEVMVAVWRKAASFDRRQTSVDTWVFRILRNRRLDALQPDRTPRATRQFAVQPNRARRLAAGAPAARPTPG
jgi:DNA-directed RNA polymerase specialized sigma24 family protein